MMRRIGWLGLVLLMWNCSGPSTETKTAEGGLELPWVFRSVLDDQARMVTAQVDEDLFLAYDSKFGGLYKAWSGNVNYDGAVYTSVHGPQPTSTGDAYLVEHFESIPWLVEVNGMLKEPDYQFLGYSVTDDEFAIKYRIGIPGNSVEITEKPSLEKRGSGLTLKRTFAVDGDLNVSLALRQANGGPAAVVQSSSDFKQGDSGDLNGLLTLTPEGETTVEFTLEASLPGEVSSEAELSSIEQGKELIFNNDCKTCHNEQEQTIGPAYIAVAERYDASAGTIAALVEKVQQGGSGNWGEVPMNPHPDLMEEDAVKMISYILSLDGDVPGAEVEVDHTLGVNSIPFDLQEESMEAAAAEEKTGLVISGYRLDNQDFMGIIEKSEPIMTGVAPAIHVTDRNDLGPLNSYVLFNIEGYLTIPETDNYDLRLVSDDGSALYIDGKMVIDNIGLHGFDPMDAEMILEAGKHSIQIVYFQAGGGAGLSFQWAKHGDSGFSVVPNSFLSHSTEMYKEVVPYIPREKLVRNVPGSGSKLTSVHPSYDLTQARPDDFQPRVGGMDFLSDGRMVVSTWDNVGGVYIVEGVQSGDPSQMTYKQIARGLAEPLGLKVVDDEIYVLQKQELTKLVDVDGDEITDEYQTISNAWNVSANFHEFAFGLVYRDGYFYATLATAIMPGGASADPQIQDRGKAVKISKENGTTEFIAHGLRTPNGIGVGVDGELFIADNQGDWLPASKIVHLQEDAFYGSRSVNFEATEGLTETLPVVWLPQNEIGNSPSTPLALNDGPYAGQMIHGEVTHGGVKRVFVEKVNGQYQGAVFRFIQGLEAGINRMVWGPDGALYVGGVGSTGNWSDEGKQWYGLQRLKYNEKTAFEPLAVRAKSNGIEIEFTEALAESSGNAVSDYDVQQWRYVPTADYGGPKVDQEDLKVRSLNISDDRRKVFLELNGLKPNHVVYLDLSGDFISESGQALWTTEAWYTLNQIPEGNPGFSSPAQAPVHNVLSEKEKSEGWELLFDGKTTTGWRNFRKETIGSAWKVANGTLYLDTSQKDGWQVKDGGDIITDKSYDNYELTLQWKIAEGANSGLIYHVQETDDYDYVWQTGPEMQILDNVRHPDGRIEKHRAGDLYDLIECSYVAVREPGEWNTVRLVSNNGKMEHWLNGHKLVEVDMTSDEWTSLVAGSKFKDMPDFGKNIQGHLALQDHGDPVWFRNIKIRPLADE